MTPERHSAFLRPKFLDRLGDKSVQFFEGDRLLALVDGDTSSGEDESDPLVRHEADGIFCRPG